MFLQICQICLENIVYKALTPLTPFLLQEPSSYLPAITNESEGFELREMIDIEVQLSWFSTFADRGSSHGRKSAA
jgi:hypothetical protein